MYTNLGKLRAWRHAYYIKNKVRFQPLYQQYREAHREENKLALKNRRIRNYKVLNEYKSRPCTDCQQIFLPCQMDFDHLPGKNKNSEIALLMTTTPTRIIAEIANCELVCSNCHRLRTWKRQLER